VLTILMDITKQSSLLCVDWRLMVVFDVAVKRTLLSEASTTILASVRSLSCVNSHVLVVMVLTMEGFITELTGMFLLHHRPIVLVVHRTMAHFVWPRSRHTARFVIFYGGIHTTQIGHPFLKIWANTDSGIGRKVLIVYTN